MTQHLFWLEPEDKWRTRGYANNQHLFIDYDTKSYDLRTEMVYPKGSDNEIIVSNKSYLKNYIGYLKKFGFRDCKNVNITV